MANTILFVFEGDKTERLLLRSFQRFYFRENGRSLIAATYGTGVYSLYQQLKNDEFLDLVEILRERSDANKTALQGISREDISEVYLFFDHDAHNSNADDEKLRELLDYFQEETEQGKLYISYPMVEAVKHICASTDFRDVFAEIANNQRYKGLVSQTCLPELTHLHELEQSHWYRINKEHSMKAWDLFCGQYGLPEQLIPQMVIFERQLEKHIRPHSSVAVLSAFPLLLLDYYGVKGLDFLCGDKL